MISANKQSQILKFYEINFYNWSFKKILKKMNLGGFLVAPAASALAQIKEDKQYYRALKNSHCAIFDSGFFCILLKIFLIYNPKKLSGFLFLKKFLAYKNIKKKKILLVNSSDYQGKLNLKLMYINKFKKVFLYTAPFYKSKNFSDKKLVNFIDKCKPNYILINIGGGKQEPLAFFLYNNIKFKSTIFCLGGAIDFITGLQAPINEFVDKFYLGWFYRIMFDPKVFFIRVFKSLNLIKYFIK